MRIAVVKPYFLPGLGYEATAWYHAFLDLGHQVRMVTTPYVRLAVRHLCEGHFSEGVENIDGGEVVRLPARMRPQPSWRPGRPACMPAKTDYFINPNMDLS